RERALRTASRRNGTSPSRSYRWTRTELHPPEIAGRRAASATANGGHSERLSGILRTSERPATHTVVIETRPTKFGDCHPVIPIGKSEPVSIVRGEPPNSDPFLGLLPY